MDNIEDYSDTSVSYNQPQQDETEGGNKLSLPTQPEHLHTGASETYGIQEPPFSTSFIKFRESDFHDETEQFQNDKNVEHKSTRRLSALRNTDSGVENIPADDELTKRRSFSFGQLELKRSGSQNQLVKHLDTFGSASEVDFLDRIPAIDQSEFDHIVRKFNKVMERLKCHSYLNIYEKEYTTLMRVLQRSHTCVRRLLLRCHLQHSIITSHDAKLTSSYVKVTDDTLPQYRAETNNRFRLYQTKTFELEDILTATRKEIDILEGEIETMTDVLDQFRSPGSLLDMYNRMREKNQSLCETRKVCLEENNSLKKKIMEFKNLTLEENQRSIDIYENKETELKLLEDCYGNIDRARTNLDQTIEETNMIKRSIDQSDNQKEKLLNQDKKMNEYFEETEFKIEKDKITKENYIRQREAFNISLEERNAEYMAKCALIEQLLELISIKKEDNKVRKEEIGELGVDIQKMQKLRDSLQKKITGLQEKKMEHDCDRQMYTIQTDNMQDDMMELRKQREQDQKICSQLQKEVEKLMLELQKECSNADKKHLLIEIFTNSTKYLEVGIQQYRDELRKHTEVVQEMSKEITDLSQKTQTLELKFADSMEELSHKENEITNYLKRVASEKIKLNQQKQLYDMLKQNQAKDSKKLIELQVEISDFRMENKMFTSMIMQLHGDVASRSCDLENMIKKRKMVEETCLKLQKQVETSCNQISMNNSFIESQQVEEQKLLRMLTKIEAERKKKRKELETVTSEHKLNVNMSLNKDHELVKHYDAYTSQRCIINKSEGIFQKMLSEIVKLQRDVVETRQLHVAMRKYFGNLDSLKRNIHTLENNLTQNAVKQTAIEIGLKKPLNVHRWRILETSYFPDWREMKFMANSKMPHPFNFEALRHIQMLTKRLIKRTQEMKTMQIGIIEKQKTYQDAKRIYCRSAGPECGEQAHIYMSALNVKKHELKAMNNELTHLRESISDYKHEMNRIRRAFEDLNKAYCQYKLGQEVKLNLYLYGVVKVPSKPKLTETSSHLSSLMYSTNDRVQFKDDENNEEKKFLEEFEHMLCKYDNIDNDQPKVSYKSGQGSIIVMNKLPDSVSSEPIISSDEVNPAEISADNHRLKTSIHLITDYLENKHIYKELYNEDSGLNAEHMVMKIGVNHENIVESADHTSDTENEISTRKHLAEALRNIKELSETVEMLTYCIKNDTLEEFLKDHLGLDKISVDEYSDDELNFALKEIMGTIDNIKHLVVDDDIGSMIKDMISRLTEEEIMNDSIHNLGVIKHLVKEVETFISQFSKLKAMCNK